MPDNNNGNSDFRRLTLEEAQKSKKGREIYIMKTVCEIHKTIQNLPCNNHQAQITETKKDVEDLKECKAKIAGGLTATEKILVLIGGLITITIAIYGALH